MKFLLIVLTVVLCASATWWYWPRKEPPAKTLSIPGPRHRLAPDGTLFLVRALSVKKPYGEERFARCIVADSEFDVVKHEFF